MPLFYDVLIVGGGVGGCMAALTAAKLNLKVLVIEKNTIIGLPVQCAEFVPKQILGVTRISRRCIMQKINSMQTIFSENVEKSQSEGFVIDKYLFNKFLAIEAVNYGAKFLIKTQIIAKKGNKLIGKQGKRLLEVHGKIIIGADGPISTVGAWIGSKNSKFVIALQAEVPLQKRISDLLIYLDPKIPGGYGWLFPKKKTANIGLGISSVFKSKPNLNYILEKTKNLHSGQIISLTSGVIPVNGKLTKIHNNNILLVGDAAGLSHPITGGGIYPALLSGKIAAESIKNALDQNNLDKLNEYSMEIDAIFGEHHRYALKKRHQMEEKWTSETLSEILRSCWVGYKEYFSES